MALTRVEKGIMKALSSINDQNIFQWPYYWSDTKKIASRPQIRECVIKLETKRRFIQLVREEKAGRKRKFYGLTFRGLLYALKTKKITPKEARTLRLRQKIKLPKSQEGPLGDLDFKPLLSHVEEQFPNYFYDMFLKGAVDLTRVNDVALATFTNVLALLALSELHRKHRELIADYVRGKDYVLPDGTICKDFVHWFRRFKKAGLTFH